MSGPVVLWSFVGLFIYHFAKGFIRRWRELHHDGQSAPKWNEAHDPDCPAARNDGVSGGDDA